MYKILPSGTTKLPDKTPQYFIVHKAALKLHKKENRYSINQSIY